MSGEHLSASGETAWRSLRQHLEWAEGFWLGWVFTDYTPSVHELHRRAEVLLRGVGRTTVLRQLREPSELVDVLLWLNAGAEGGDGCVIVAVVRSGDDWRDAWDQFMLRLNERRELIKDKIRGGLLLVAPTSFKARTREAAPDLWSIRSLAVEVAPVVGEMPEARVVALIEPEAVAGSDTEVTLALQAVNAARRAGQVDPEVDARIRAAEALFAFGRRDEGREQAVAAVEVAASDQASARALVTLANIERQLGDFVAAERHYRAAIDANGEDVQVRAYYHLVDILLGSHALPEARGVADIGLAVSRSRRESRGETPETLRDESLSWGRLGRVKEAQGDWSGAGDAYDARLSLIRKRRSRIGDTPDVLRDEFLAWLGIGDVKRTRGDLTGAGEAYDASLALTRTIRTIVGATAESLRDESVCLNKVGALRMSQNDWDGAREAYEASLILSRRMREMTGDTADGLRDEAMALASVGDVRLAQGAVAEAANAYEASLELRRKLKEMVGATADALRDEAVGLARIGEVREAHGDWKRAEQAYREGLELLRQARRVAGDTVRLLDATACVLRFCAQVDRHECGQESARDALLEAAQCWREIQARCGELPRNMNGLAAVLEDLRGVEDEIAGLRVSE